MRRNRGGRTSGVAEQGRRAVLEAVPALRSCDDAGLRRIAALGTEVRRPAGTVLQRAGGPLRQVLVVLDGVVAERPTDGREQAVSTGHVVGEAALTRAHAVARSTVEALTEVRLLVFGPMELADVADELSRRTSPRPAVGPVRRPVQEPTWGSAMPAVA